MEGSTVGLYVVVVVANADENDVLRRLEGLDVVAAGTSATLEQFPTPTVMVAQDRSLRE